MNMNILDLQQPGPKRPLCQPPRQTMLARVAVQKGNANVDAAALLFQVRLDKATLSAHIRQSL
jgi:hypothetical protein